MPAPVYTPEMDQVIKDAIYTRVYNNGDNIKTVIEYLSNKLNKSYKSVEFRYYSTIRKYIDNDKFSEQLTINEANRRYNIHMNRSGDDGEVNLEV